MTTTSAKRNLAISANRLSYWLSRNWIVAFSLIFGLYVVAPFLAPVFMHYNWIGLGSIIYKIYSFLCHQMPERSFFFFGSKTMYSLAEIQLVSQNSTNLLELRQFIGNTSMGWKVAWSDRMVSMYTSMLIFAWLWWPLRKRLKSVPIWGFILLLVPMAVDGTTHLFSDLAGIGQGFRENNLWLVALTNNAFEPSFYVGNALGSFNSWMRLITGTLFGIGVVWFLFPYLAESFEHNNRVIKTKFERAGLEL
jgi:uncharacterized membrane protein